MKSHKTTLYIRLLTLAAGVFLFGTAPIQATAEAPEVLRYTGRAYDLNTGRFVYSENHAEYRKNGEHSHSVVTYRDAAGKVFARKRISFVKNPTRPDFRLEDYRDGYLEGATLLGGNRFKFYKRQTKDAEIESEVVDLASPGVIDGGFDYYVRQNFDSLKAGKTHNVNFGVSARFTYFTFTINKVGESNRAGRNAVSFRLAPQNFLLRQLIEPLIITYDTNNRRLLEYRGYTNIDDGTNSGRNFEARIVFDYPEVVVNAASL